MITFDLSNQKPITTRLGACIYREDSSKFKVWQNLAAELGFQIYYYTQSLTDPYEIIPSDTAAIQEFLSVTGAKVGVEYPIADANVLANFPQYLAYLISLNPDFIQLGRETLSLPNETYIARCNQVMAYAPQIVYSWDGADVWRVAPKGILRNMAIAEQPLFLVKQYNHLSPDRVVFTENQNENRVLVDHYCDTLLPQDKTNFNSILPDKVENTIQLHFSDNLTQKLSEPLENYAVGKRVAQALANTDNYANLFWMQLSGLFQGQYPKAIYDHWKRVAPLFKYPFVIPVTSDIPGVVATGFSDGGNQFALLLTNNTSVKHTITKADITIAGKTVAGNFLRDTGWAQSWNADLQQEIVVQPKIVVRKNSVSVITFATQ